MLQPDRQPIRVTPPEPAAAAPSVNVETPFADLAAEVAKARAAAQAEIDLMRQATGVSTRLAQTLRGAVDETLHAPARMVSRLTPLLIDSITTAICAFGAFHSVPAQPELAAVLTAFAAGMTIKNVLSIYGLRRSAEPERIAGFFLHVLNRESEATHDNYAYALRGMGEAISASCDPKVYLLAEGRQQLEKLVSNMSGLSQMQRLATYEAIVEPHAKSQPVLSEMKRYAFVYLKAAGPVSGYLQSRMKLLKEDAPVFKHYELNEVGEDLAKLFHELADALPRYRFNMPDDPALKNESYTFPSLWGALRGRIPLRKG